MALRTRFDLLLKAQLKGVHFFPAAKRDEVYFRAGPYLLEQLKILLEDGWKRNESNSNSEVLFDIYKPMEAKEGHQPRRESLILPKTFASFLDTYKANTWRTVFENPVIFKAGKKGDNNNLDLYIESSPPLSNIFYLLQVLSPGMLAIYHEYQLQDADVKVSRVLPQASWIESNREVMSKTDALLAAANDRKIAFHEERTARPQNNSLSGTDALPAAAKDQKTPFLKKQRIGRRLRPRNHNQKITFLPGHLNLNPYDNKFDTTYCELDECGYCGRCRIFGLY